MTENGDDAEGNNARPRLRLYNSLTKTTEPVEPINGNELGWYLCGPTVYDSAHLGHARTYVAFDVMRRVVRDYFGYDVDFVLNVTDIDDKIILQAHKSRASSVIDAARRLESEQNFKPPNELKELDQLLNDNSKDLPKYMHLCRAVVDSAKERISKEVLSSHESYAPIITDWNPQTGFMEHARLYEQSFMEDLASLNILKPSRLLRVSEHVDEIIEFIQQIIHKGNAYKTKSGSVYFNTVRFSSTKGFTYGKLRHSALDDVSECMEAEGALTHQGDGEGSKPSTQSEKGRDTNSEPEAKKHEADFALWKPSKEGEPGWESPFGFGRPGWHIECSAMCSEIFGGKVDINSGGVDLLFPHHENQLAQSEAKWGCECWVKHFLHSGHLHINGLKMSKSLKNFVTIGTCLLTYDWREIRALFLMTRWCDGMELTPLEDGRIKQMSMPVAFIHLLDNFFFEIESLLNASPVKEKQRQIKEKEAESSLRNKFTSTKNKVHESLCNNLDTASAMEDVKKLVHSTNSYMQHNNDRGESLSTFLLSDISGYVDRVLSIFGLKSEKRSPAGEEKKNSEEGLKQAGEYIDCLSRFREKMRRIALEAKKEGGHALAGEILKECDRMRDEELPEMNVRLDDKAGEGEARWRLEKRRGSDSSKVREEKRGEEEEEEEEKPIEPKRLFVEGKNANEFSELDEEGMPRCDWDGKPLSTNKLKAAAKMMRNQIDRYERYKQRKSKK